MLINPIIRQQRFELSGYQCEYSELDYTGKHSIRCCKITKNLHVHHITYDRRGNEYINDVIVLCEKHHAMEHLLKINCEICGDSALLTHENAENHWEEHILNCEDFDDWGYKLDYAKDCVEKLCSNCEHFMVSEHT